MVDWCSQPWGRSARRRRSELPPPAVSLSVLRVTPFMYNHLKLQVMPPPFLHFLQNHILHELWVQHHRPPPHLLQAGHGQVVVRILQARELSKKPRQRGIPLSVPTKTLLQKSHPPPRLPIVTLGVCRCGPVVRQRVLPVGAMVRVHPRPLPEHPSHEPRHGVVGELLRLARHHARDLVARVEEELIVGGHQELRRVQRGIEHADRCEAVLLVLEQGLVHGGRSNAVEELLFMNIPGADAVEGLRIDPEGPVLVSKERGGRVAPRHGLP
mmetsp:Transcript_29105/g.92903  ORF Transcript_29105/g.92903 Transcript_29105/m.92903 type:complete len:269 (+) Transcript_29105:642-1448(+)